MKSIHAILSIIVTVFISIVARAQDTGPVSEMYLKGKYNVECATEVMDQAGIRRSELCPFIISPINKSSATLKDFEMIFGTDSLTLIQDETITTVPYTRNIDTHAFQFTFNKKQYHFRVFLYNRQRIIEDADGMILVLTRAD